MRLLRALVATAVLAAAPLVAARVSSAEDAPAAEEFVRTSDRFRVVCHGTNARIADATLVACESAWSAVATLFPGAPPAAGGRPLVLNVYSRYEDYSEAATKNGFASYAAKRLNVAYSQSLCAYVLFDPSGDAAVVARVGPTWPYLKQVAHEAAHLAVAQRVGGKWTDAEWLSEGVATWAEDLAIQAMGCDQGVRAEPGACCNMYVCRRHRTEGKFPALAAVFEGRLPGFEIPDRYPVFWALVRFLLAPERRARANSLFAAARGLPGGGDFAANLFEAAKRIWPGDEWTALEADFLAEVDAFAPEWGAWTGDVHVEGTRWTQWSEPGRGCGIVWRGGDAGRPQYSVTGKFEIQPYGPTHAAMVLLGRTKKGFLIAYFLGGQSVEVFEGRFGKKLEELRWEWVASSAVAPPVGVETEFEVRVAPGELTIRLSGKDALRVPLDGRDMTGAWGVGVAEGALAMWSDVRLR